MSDLELKNKGVYRFITDPSGVADKHLCIELLRAPYEGVIFRYGLFQLGKETKPDGTMPYRFTYDVIQMPESLKGKELGDEGEKDFVGLLGDIIIELLTHHYENPNSPELMGAENICLFPGEPDSNDNNERTN